MEKKIMNQPNEFKKLRLYTKKCKFKNNNFCYSKAGRAGTKQEELLKIPILRYANWKNGQFDSTPKNYFTFWVHQ